jgi:hypothetical protein
MQCCSYERAVEMTGDGSICDSNSPAIGPRGIGRYSNCFLWILHGLGCVALNISRFETLTGTLLWCLQTSEHAAGISQGSQSLVYPRFEALRLCVPAKLDFQLSAVICDIPALLAGTKH